MEKGIDSDQVAHNALLCQPTLVIGLVGNMNHGKTTLVNELCGFEVFPEEQTTKLGFASAKIYKCGEDWCNCSTRYVIRGSRGKDCGFDGHETCKMKLIRHISFLDCPGHPNFVPTVLAGLEIADAALLLISANESCRQPQTVEHLVALEVKSIKEIIIIQSKIDRVSNKRKSMHHEAIKEFLLNTVAEDSQILEKGPNFVEIICTSIENIPLPVRNLATSAIMLILQGDDESDTQIHTDGRRISIVHGVVLEGTLKPNKQMGIKPGSVVRKENTIKCQTISALTISLYSEETQIPCAIPGGMITLHVVIEPYLLPHSLPGRLLGEIEGLPDVFSSLKVKYCLLPRFVGLSRAVIKQLRMNDIYLITGELLLITIGAMSTAAVVQSADKSEAKLGLTFPLCVRRGDKIILCRRVGLSWRLAGRGYVSAGVMI